MSRRSDWNADGAGSSPARRKGIVRSVLNLPLSFTLSLYCVGNVDKSVCLNSALCH